MKKVGLGILACFSMGMPMDAAAIDDYVGYSLDAVKSSDNGENNTSAGFLSMISARPNEYYGWEVQGGILGEVGSYSVSGEADFCIVGLMPLGDSGIKLYGKAGGDATYSSGSVYHSGLTYGAGVEYQLGKDAVRLGFQHLDVGKYPSFSTKLIGITLLFSLKK
jgi:hypothetical protein